MSDISTVNVNGTSYNIKDTVARNAADSASQAATAAASVAATAQATATAALAAAQQSSGSSSYQDLSATSGVISITTTSVPVAVELNSVIYIPKGMTRNGSTFSIPVAPILAEANLASYSGTYRVWLA